MPRAFSHQLQKVQLFPLRAAVYDGEQQNAVIFLPSGHVSVYQLQKYTFFAATVSQEGLIHINNCIFCT